MSKIYVELVSPEKKIFEGEAVSVSLPGAKAPFCVLPNHIDLISGLAPGKVVINTGSDELIYVVDGGFAEVHNNRVSVLVESALLPTEIDLAQQEDALEKLNSLVTASDTEMCQKIRDLEIVREKIRAVKNLN